jgi:hypothetical protein
VGQSSGQLAAAVQRDGRLERTHSCGKILPRSRSALDYLTALAKENPKVLTIRNTPTKRRSITDTDGFADRQEIVGNNGSPIPT